MTTHPDPDPTAGAERGSAPVDFPIAWERPADLEVTWDWDDMHLPFAIPPLTADYTLVLGEGMNHCYEIFGDFPQRTHCRIWNGYAYFGHRSNVPTSDREALNRRWLDVMRRRAEVTESYWVDEVLPEVRALEAGIRAIDVEGLSRSDLADAWDAAWAATARMWQLHFCIILGPYTIVEELADLYEEVVAGAAPGESVRLIQGARNELFEVELGVEHLIAAARAQPAVRDHLIAAGHHPGATEAPTWTSVGALPGSEGFLALLETFLIEHGHLGQGFDDLALPSWAEDPSMLLVEIGRRLVVPAGPAEERQARLAAEAEALADAMRERLAERPEEHARFERVLALARSIGQLTEGHNYWMDRMAQARIRAFSMRVGARLAAAGSIGSAEDVLYLHRPEVRDLIEQPVDQRGLVARRRAEHVRQLAMTPPASVGAVRTKPFEGDRFDGTPQISEEVDVLLGTGASIGTVRGPARLVLSPADFGRIQAGDIIVCPSSNPSWVPVFTFAGGLVTNTGGILSHAAVVAREFGLPAVVGVTDATTRISEGRTIEIDGVTGSVRLL